MLRTFGKGAGLSTDIAVLRTFGMGADLSTDITVLRTFAWCNLEKTFASFVVRKISELKPSTLPLKPKE